MPNKNSAKGFFKKALISVLEGANKVANAFKSDKPKRKKENYGGFRASQTSTVSQSSNSGASSAPKKAIFIAFAVVAALAVGGVTTGNMIATNNQLEENLTSLQSNYNSLSTEHSTLESDYDTCTTERDDWKSDYQSCDSNLTSLQGDYDKLDEEYDELFGKHDQCVGDLKDETKKLNSCLSREDDLEVDLEFLEEDYTSLEKDSARRLCGCPTPGNDETRNYTLDDNRITCTSNGNKTVQC